MPTILITYADDANAPLRVAEESNAIQSILEDMPNKGFEISKLSRVSTANLVEHLTRKDKDLEVLHYSGHANSNALAFSGNAADAQNLAERLRFCTNLKLVFLNGCLTKGQVRFFHEAGVPYVLATSAKVSDDEAVWFAAQFYRYLASGEDVEDAFKKAEADGKVDGRDLHLTLTRDVSGLYEDTDEADFDWGMYVGEGGKGYKLPVRGAEESKHTFNETLTRQLITAIQPHSVAARRFMEKVSNIPDWETQVRISDKAKEIIAYSFVGVLGIQLSKLMAIGKEAFSAAKQRKYIVKCIDISRYTLELLGTALLSRLWDEQRQQSRNFSTTERAALEAFFDNHFDPSLLERLRLVQALSRIFDQPAHALPLPMPDWPAFAAALEEGTIFTAACKSLASLQERIDRGQYDQADCAEAEEQLAVLLSQLGFLTQYHMASIRHIGYWQPRHTDARYLHRYTALGIDNKAQKDAEKINCTPETVQTDAVLLYRDGSYAEHICLTPFVIDYNALTYEHGPKICFYRSQTIDSDILEYVFHEDGSPVRLEKQGILQADTDLNTLLLEQQKHKTLNLDNMVSLFHEARTCLLGDIDFEDL